MQSCILLTMGNTFNRTKSFAYKKNVYNNVIDVKEATTRFELVIRVLQTHALPLGYVAIVTPTGIEPVLPP